MLQLCHLCSFSFAFVFFSCIIFAMPHRRVEQHYTRSVIGMVPLLTLEDQIVRNLAAYKILLTRKVEIVHSALSALHAVEKSWRGNARTNRTNPLNKLMLVRHTHADWLSWQTFMKQKVGSAQVVKIRKLLPRLPSSNDLAEASLAVRHLQMAYDLEPDDMVNGLLNGKQYSSSLSALDCFELGSFLYERKHYSEAGCWLFSALKLYFQPLSKMDKFPNADYGSIAYLYINTLMKLENYKDALRAVEMAMQVGPTDVNLMRCKADIEKHMAGQGVLAADNIEAMPEDLAPTCGGHFEYDSDLFCIYNNDTTAFLRLAPIKMEILQLDPYMVVLYHDVLSDNEVADLKRMASKNLTLAQVYNQHSNESDPNYNVRIAKTASLEAAGDSTLTRLHTRMEDMTGLSVDDAERLEVANYGMAGHFGPHVDFANLSNRNVRNFEHTGNRIATILFYLSDVTQGGATLFLSSRIGVYPRKGSALFWYNLENTGDGIPATIHTACPVIVGSKWVATKWISERPQMFRMPCYTSDSF